MSPQWIDVADGVFARRHDELDQTIGLVLGSRRCLVVDTGTDEAHGAELAAAVRELTPLPWTVVITHAHFDHYFGTAPFLPAPVVAHERCVAALRASAEADRRVWRARYVEQGKPELAARLAAARLVLPTTLFADRLDLDIGDRAVSLRHLGLGHTDHDVVVHVPDVGVVFAGDLVEQGAPPSIGPDTVLGSWPSTLDNLLALAPAIVVPGHGEPVTPEFVRDQRDELHERSTRRS